MPEKKDLLEELAEDGLDPAIIERLRNWADGSPLRRVAKSAEQRANEAEERAKRLEETVKKSVFREVGITVDPKYLTLPDDLDVTDSAAVKKWAIEAKFVTPGPNVDNAELEEHENAERVTEGTDSPESGVITPTMAAEWPIDRQLKFRNSNPDAWEELKRGNEVRGVPVT